MPGLPVVLLVVLLEVMLISGKPENEIHAQIVRPGKHLGTGGLLWLAYWGIGIPRDREPPSDLVVCSHSTFVALNTFNRFVTPPDP